MYEVFSKSLLLRWLQFPGVSIIMRAHHPGSPRLEPFLLLPYVHQLPTHHPCIVQTRWIVGSPATLSLVPPVWVWSLGSWFCHILRGPPAYLPIPLSHHHCLVSGPRCFSSGSFPEPSAHGPLGFDSVMPLRWVCKYTAVGVTPFGCSHENRRALKETPPPKGSSTEPAQETRKCSAPNGNAVLLLRALQRCPSDWNAPLPLSTF